MKTNRNKRGTMHVEAMEKRELFAADLGMDLAIATSPPEPQAACFARLGDIEGTSEAVEPTTEQSIVSPNTNPDPPPLGDFHNAVCDLVLVNGSSAGGQQTSQAADSEFSRETEPTSGRTGYSDVKRVAIKIGSNHGTSLAIDSFFASSSYNDLSIATCDPLFR